MIDTRLLAYLVWGVGTVIVYLVVLYRRRIAYARLHTRKALQDLVSSFALFITALCSFLAITGVFFTEMGAGIRGFFVAIALGAFFASGLIQMRDEN